MKKIIRSQLYQLFLDKAIIVILIPWLISLAAAIIQRESDVSISIPEDLQPGSLFFVKIWLENHSYTTIFAFIISALLLAKDFGDKTINYEILSGKTRTQVLFSRFLLALAINESMMLIQLWVYPLTYAVRFGWGINYSVRDALITTMLFIFYIFRVTAEVALFAVLLKRKSFTYFVPVILMFVGEIIGEMIFSELMFISENERYIPEWIIRLTDIFTMGIYTTIIQLPSEKIMDASNKSFEHYMAFDKPFALGEEIVMTLGVGLILMTIAYRKFSRKDME